MRLYGNYSYHHDCAEAWYRPSKPERADAAESQTQEPHFYQFLDRVHQYVNIAPMKRIHFYKTPAGVSPVEDFLDTLSDNQTKKILWVLKLVRELDPVPSQYFTKLINTDDIWEIRAQLGGNIFRLLGFIESDSLVILTNGFQKKTQKHPDVKSNWRKPGNASIKTGR
jgi:phage-related protein